MVFKLIWKPRSVPNWDIKDPILRNCSLPYHCGHTIKCFHRVFKDRIKSSHNSEYWCEQCFGIISRTSPTAIIVAILVYFFSVPRYSVTVTDITDIGMLITALKINLVFNSDPSINASTRAPLASFLSVLASDNRSLILMLCSVFTLCKAKTIMLRLVSLLRTRLCWEFSRSLNEVSARTIPYLQNKRILFTRLKFISSLHQKRMHYFRTSPE